MKKTLVLFLLIPAFSFAQLGLLGGGKNIIKVNPLSLALNNYNITYERSFLRKFSLSLGLRYMPKTGMPAAAKAYVKALVDNQVDFNIDYFKFGNTALTGEFRIYPRKSLKGFYVAPHLRYANFNMTFPVVSTSLKEPLLLEGKLNTFCGGLLIGRQFTIAGHFIIDLYILGVQYGSGSGTLSAENIEPKLSASDQESVDQH